MAAQLPRRAGTTIKTLCRDLGIGASSLRRWQSRARNHQPLLRRPGPKPLGPLPFVTLRAAVRDLLASKAHAKRIRGSAALYTQYRNDASRRTVFKFLFHQRRQVRRARRSALTRVRWLQPNLAWAIDASMFPRDSRGRPLFIVAVRDLASRLLFPPLAALALDGSMIATYLRGLFAKFGPPLLLKRDNGSIFNNDPVDALLSLSLVIPLNSPAFHPQYNGSIENAFAQIKSLPAPATLCPRFWNPRAVADYLHASTHLINSRPRRCLRGHCAAEHYQFAPRSRFGKQARHHAFEWINARSNVTIQNMDRPDQRSVRAAWRLAVEAWLRCHALIEVSINNHVLPNLPSKIAH